MTLLDIQNLGVTFHGSSGEPPVRAVDDVSLRLDAGQTLAIVGESGSGKTVTALSLLGLNPPSPLCESTGTILLDGTDLSTLDRSSWRQVRGNRVAMVFQDPGTALNPLLTIGTQLVDAVRAHERTSRDQARRRAVEALAQARMPEPEKRLGQYVHELSGGMRQRGGRGPESSAPPQPLPSTEPTPPPHTPPAGESNSKPRPFF
ncbi:ATP-binding cassette domain-containing protein, partial [Streptomyces sp. NPDC056294]|uniref:ATP-binding cassette domain-containing protein n=1 Tax=Streptomyces sp. NPDC056294 TaxID=3345773 RepID=UPI0035D71150